MATIKDIAQAAKVTLGTVSRALNNEPGVGDKTRERILQIAKELNYSRSVPAKKQALQAEAKSIGIIWHRGNGLFFGHMCNEMERQANARGYSTLVSIANPERAFQLFHRHQVDHIASWCLPTWTPTYAFLQTKEQFKGNMLMLGGALLDRSHRLTIDRKGAIYEGVRHLAELGHTRLAFVGAETEKLIGFTMGILDFQLHYRPESIVLTDRLAPFPEERLLHLLRQPEASRPTAFVVDSQGNLYRFVHFIRKHGYRVPDDFSLVVYDAIYEMEFVLDVPLTTVGPNVESLAKQAIGLLLDDAPAGEEQWRNATAESELIARASTVSPK